MSPGGYWASPRGSYVLMDLTTRLVSSPGRTGRPSVAFVLSPVALQMQSIDLGTIQLVVFKPLVGPSVSVLLARAVAEVGFSVVYSMIGLYLLTSEASSTCTDTTRAHVHSLTNIFTHYLLFSEPVHNFYNRMIRQCA